jgi:drug/metabolite transporter (DMT)-like permease
MALWIDHEERAEGWRLAGLVLGFTGVIVLLGLDVAGRPGELLGGLAILLATVGYAAGPMMVKHRFRGIDPLGPVTASMGISALVLLPAAALSAPTEVPSGETLMSVVVLGVVCSAAGFLLFFALIAEVGPGRATVITFVNPVVAVALGIALLGESLGPSAVAGLLLILAGSWLSTGGRLPPGLMTPVTSRRRRGEAAAQRT